LLSNRANVLLHLAPAPVVVRVATTTALVRPAVADTLAKDVALAGYLAEQGAPVVAPSPDLPPGPHHRDGFALTFWTYVAHDPDRRIAPAEVGVLLDELHAVLRGYPGVLPGVPPLDVPEITRYLRTRAHDPAALA